MTKRSKKLLSLLLASAMVFSMNTSAFAEEVELDSTDEVTVETADATVDDVANVDEAKATLDSTTTEYEAGGLYYSVDENYDSTCLSTITYSKDPDNKKAIAADVAKITKCTDPVSWNNHYATDLIETVVDGTNSTDESLNNSSTITVSENYDPDWISNAKNFPAEYRFHNANARYSVIPVKTGEVYLFVKYSTEDGAANIEGYDDPEDKGYGETTVATLPYVDWDGRKIDLNKSGIHKYDKGKKEVLDVKVALVKFSGDTVEEIPGVEANVKVDTKNLKNASVAYQTTMATKTIKEWGTDDEGKDVLKDKTEGIAEHKKLGDLPFFTLSVKAKGKSAKEYKKEITTAMKEEANNKYYFGVMQMAVDIDHNMTQYYGKYVTGGSTDLDKEDNNYTISGDAAKEIEKDIAEVLMSDGVSRVRNEEEYNLNDQLKISKFDEKGKATITVLGKIGDDKKVVGYHEELGKLKDKNDYGFTSGTLAGGSVQVLDLGGTNNNVIYSPLMKRAYNKGTTAKPEYVERTIKPTTLAPLGYKWAFRKTPATEAEKKPKTFRSGFLKDSANGFVYEVED